MRHHRFGRLLAAAAIATGLVGTVGIASADDPRIVRVTGEVLKVFDAPTGRIVHRIPAAEVPVPLHVKSVAPNARMEVAFGAISGWVDPSGVEVAGGPVAQVCRGRAEMTKTAGTRGVGRPC